jgi:hypothetical protein
MGHGQTTRPSICVSLDVPLCRSSGYCWRYRIIMEGHADFSCLFSTSVVVAQRLKRQRRISFVFDRASGGGGGGCRCALQAWRVSESARIYPHLHRHATIRRNLKLLNARQARSRLASDFQRSPAIYARNDKIPPSRQQSRKQQRKATHRLAYNIVRRMPS